MRNNIVQILLLIVRMCQGHLALVSLSRAYLSSVVIELQSARKITLVYSAVKENYTFRLGNAKT